jgi:hypothetical protein
MTFKDSFGELRTVCYCANMTHIPFATIRTQKSSNVALISHGDYSCIRDFEITNTKKNLGH